MEKRYWLKEAVTMSERLDYVRQLETQISATQTALAKLKPERDDVLWVFTLKS